MNNNLTIKINITLFFLIVLSSCGYLGSESQPAGDFSSIKSVEVSLLNETEVDQLLTISKLPAGSCVESGQSKDCSIDSNLALKWGFGFCTENQELLDSKKTKADVTLFVDNIQVPDSLIFERDEVYDRDQNAYCHVWLIKLNNWQREKTIQLENKAKLSLFESYNYKYIIKIKK